MALSLTFMLVRPTGFVMTIQDVERPVQVLSQTLTKSKTGHRAIVLPEYSCRF